jgi:hypothetical protein
MSYSGERTSTDARLGATAATSPLKVGVPAQPGRFTGARRYIGFLGIAMALPFFVWLPLGFVESVPSMLEVFGMVGLRIPASITIGGLLLAAIGFHEI